jgi:hypothetical protein
LALFENPANNSAAPTNVLGTILNTPLTPVDSSTVFSLTFSGSKLAAQAALSTSITLNSLDPGVTIRFERGTILISPPIYCPKEFKVQYLGKNGKIEKEERRVFEYVGGGLHFEADEVARCIRDGKKESALWGHEKSLLEMSIFDEVRRAIRLLMESTNSPGLSRHRFAAREDMCFLQASKEFWNNSGVLTTCTMCVLIRMYIDGYDIKYAIYQARIRQRTLFLPTKLHDFPDSFVHRPTSHERRIRLHEPSTVKASVRSSSLISTPFKYWSVMPGWHPLQHPRRCLGDSHIRIVDVSPPVAPDGWPSSVPACLKLQSENNQ